MQKKLLFLILSVFFIFPCFAQDFYDFKAGKSYLQILESSNKDELIALHRADSLAANSSNRTAIIEAKMISASIYEKSGDYHKAINLAFEGLNEANKIKESFSEATIFLFLARQFRKIGYSVQGEEFIAKADKIIASLAVDKTSYRLKGELFLEKGELLLEKKKYDKAVHKFNLAHPLFLRYELNENLKNLYLARNEYLLGTSYYHLKKFKRSFKHYDESYYYTQLSDPKAKISRAWIYNGYANLYLELEDLHCSELYFQKSLQMAESTKCNLLKKSVYHNALKFYRQKNNTDSIMLYSQKYISILTRINQSQKKILQAGMWTDQNLSNESSNNIIYLGIGAAAIIGIIVFFNNILIRNNIYKNELDKETPIAGHKTDNDNYLPAATEQSLLSRLHEFEKREKFLNKKMRLSLMATQLQTNAKYLRYILKKHKNTDYNTYINELRVSYIIEKLNSDPSYLQYKISYLADEAGFSSHSKFSKTFKRLTKCAPSDYIRKMQFATA